jgi:hypothetical protein
MHPVQTPFQLLEEINEGVSLTPMRPALEFLSRHPADWSPSNQEQEGLRKSFAAALRFSSESHTQMRARNRNKIECGIFQEQRDEQDEPNHTTCGVVASAQFTIVVRPRCR